MMDGPQELDSKMKENAPNMDIFFHDGTFWILKAVKGIVWHFWEKLLFYCKS